MAGSQSDKDYYVILEVDRKVDSDTIKKAYRRLALKFHPDRNKGNEKEAEEKFREIHEAYAVLSDPEKRAEYDSKGVNGIPDRPAYQNTADLFGMFNTFFGGDPFAHHRHHFFNPTRPGFGNRSSSFHDFNFPSSSSSSSSSSSFRHSTFESTPPPPPKPKQQHKVRLTVDVTFNESVVGCSKDISLEYTVKCSLCSGTGIFSGRVHDAMCGKCGGSGRLKETKGGISMSVNCPDCFGQGRRTGSACLACTGGGRIQKIHQEEIVVPPGVSHGSAMKRVVNLDDENAEADLYEITVEINVENHKFFKRKGINVHLEVPISYTQAVLGDTIQVPCIYGGTIEVDVPPGTQPLSEFILIGQGFFNLEGNGQGDMILKWVLEVPKVISDEERKVLLNLSQLEHGDLPEKRVQFFQFMCDWDAESVL